MRFQEIGTYLGYIAVAAFVFYITVKALSLNNKVMEGLRSRESSDDSTEKGIAALGGKSPREILDTVKKAREQLSDILLIDKYKSEYQDILLEVQDTLNLGAIDYIAASGGKIKDADAARLSNANSAAQYIATLDKWLDNYSSSSGSGGTSSFGGKASSFFKGGNSRNGNGNGNGNGGRSRGFFG